MRDPSIPSGLPCDVDAILANRCQRCHSSPPQYGAPMPLVMHADLVAGSPSDANVKVHDRVLQKIADDADPMPPPPNTRLEAGEIATLRAWVESGAPSSTVNCSTPPVVDPGLDVKCTPDLSIGPGTPWEMPQSTRDEYVCYGVDISRPSPTHITGFVPRIDNATIVHHILLLEAPSAYSPTPTPCGSGTSIQWRIVMGWAPGSKGLEMPADVGFPVGSGGSTTHYVVQMHYSNINGLAGQKDATGFDLCTSALRKYEADVLAFGTRRINIPPNATKTADCSYKIPSQAGQTNLIAALPHMHKLGTAMSTTMTPAGGGTEVDMGTMTTFSFDTQAWLPLTGALKPGDTVRTKCTWKNNTGAPVGFGERTEDEMCYSFTMYYPRIRLPFWSWAAPAELSSCQ
jgi:hypothetical protein